MHRPRRYHLWLLLLLAAMLIAACGGSNDDDDDQSGQLTAVPTQEVTVDVEATAEVTETPAPSATAEVTPEVTQVVRDGDVIIIIEGPVENINVNIITIFGIDIELDDDDPLLTVIQIGDILRIEGSPGENNIIIAIVIIFINVDVVVVDGEVWRDPGNCNNPPPPWAPAHGWRSRCGGGGQGGGEGSGKNKDKDKGKGKGEGSGS